MVMHWSACGIGMTTHGKNLQKTLINRWKLTYSAKPRLRQEPGEYAYTALDRKREGRQASL